MNDSTRRAIRSGLDLVLGVLVALGAVFLLPNINEQMNDLGLGKAFSIFGLIVLVATTIITKLKNYLEDEKNFPALLKAPASYGQNPVPGDQANPKV
jgi:hypothetical protein